MANPLIQSHDHNQKPHTKAQRAEAFSFSTFSVANKEIRERREGKMIPWLETCANF